MSNWKNRQKELPFKQVVQEVVGLAILGGQVGGGGVLSTLRGRGKR